MYSNIPDTLDEKDNEYNKSNQKHNHNLDFLAQSYKGTFHLSVS